MKPIILDTPEMCGKHMLHSIRNGKEVSCPQGHLIQITHVEYVNNWKPETKSNRGHVRGHARGNHRGPVA